MTLMTERRAERAARTRALRDARRDAKPRRTTAQKDEERERKGRPTLVEQRGGLPSFTTARKRATHADAANPMRAFVQSADDPTLFACALRVKGLAPPIAGEVLTLTTKETGATAQYKVLESVQLTTRLFSVALRPTA